MIIGTAGHIDHGKTTLIRALTGVETDRLPEEKRRGISIELGYAYLPAADDSVIAFVDVPGHERLVHTMLAGATGVDHALLVVAADDGPMPQTREHLAVLSLLGVPAGTVVITKCDRVDAARLAAVCAEVQTLCAGSMLEGAPVHTVSAPTGAGIDALREQLMAAAAAQGAATDDALGFRMAVDRAFTLDGVGTVATGTVHQGSVRLGDELALIPGGAAARRLRVRGLHAQQRVATVAVAGQRCAVALAGIGKDELHRGQWLAAPALALETDRIDVQLTLWQGESKALRPGTTVHLHTGTADVMASVALLEGDALQPGHTALAQLVLRAPLAAWRGDRFVLRDASATRTLAGGCVLDPFAPARQRRSSERMALLAAARASETTERLAQAVAAAGLGIDLDRWTRAEGRTDHAAALLPAGAVQAAGTAFGPGAWQMLRERSIAALDAHHRSSPDAPGTDAARLQRLALPRLGSPAWQALLRTLIADGSVVQRGAWLQRPEHGARLSAAEQRIAQKLLPLLHNGRYDPPWARDLAVATGEPPALLRTTLARLARNGEAYAIVPDLYYHARRVDELVAQVRRLVELHGSVRAADFRDATGLGRKRAIQILEFFDRIGVLRRVGEAHRLHVGAEAFGPAAP